MDQSITISVSSITAIVAVASAVFAFFGGIFAVYRWYLKQGKTIKDVSRVKAEQALIVYALSSCLDGLQQLGANHTVTEAKDKLDKYINEQAHRQED